MVEAGIARDAKLGFPLQCLHVVLTDSADRAVAHAVTDSSGQFQLEAPTPGAYRVQFLVYGWEALTGPLDTLADGSFKQRIYPLTFASMLVPDTSFRLPPNEMTRRQHQERRERFEAYLRRYEADGVWRSRRVIPQGIEFFYPSKLRAARVEGSVLAYFIVDSTGRARPESWRTVSATHPDFESTIRDALPRSRWRPAESGGRPTCELTLDHARFYLTGDVARSVLDTR